MSNGVSDKKDHERAEARDGVASPQAKAQLQDVEQGFSLRAPTKPEEPSPMEKLTDLARRIVAVPKEEVDEKAREFDRQRQERRRAAH